MILLQMSKPSDIGKTHRDRLRKWLRYYRRVSSDTYKTGAAFAAALGIQEGTLSGYLSPKGRGTFGLDVFLKLRTELRADLNYCVDWDPPDGAGVPSVLPQTPSSVAASPRKQKVGGKR